MNSDAPDVTATPVPEGCPHEILVHQERLRADRAEANLARAELKLARLLHLAQAWDDHLPEIGRTAVLTESVRATISSTYTER